MSFHQKKFLRLPGKQQHKKCAEILRELYLASYNQVAEWVGEKALENPTAEEISNRYHRHLKASERGVKEHNLLPKVTIGDKQMGDAPFPVSIFLDQLRSAHNVGSIIRTTEALRVGKIYASEDTPGTDNKQVQNTSMNTWEWVDFEKKELSSLPRPFIALETTENSIPLDEFTFPESFTLILGNEEFGLSENSLSLADHFVCIPLRGRKNSLNVAACYAIAAHEIVRQRKKQ